MRGALDDNRVPEDRAESFVTQYEVVCLLCCGPIPCIWLTLLVNLSAIIRILQCGVLFEMVQRKGELNAMLRTTGFNFPNLVDAEWRLDFHMKSNRLEFVLRFGIVVLSGLSDSHS